MQCEACREAISARLDGEATAAEIVAVDAHLATCAGCRRFSTQASELHRSVRVRAAEAVPDLSAPILAGARPRPPLPWPRYALAAIGLMQLVIAVPGLIFGDGADASVHAARELGAWDIALAIGLLVAAWQPRRATGLFPMVAALAGAMVVASVFDIAGGRAPLGGEVHHLLDLCGVVTLWLLVQSTGGMRVRPRTA